MKYYDGSLTLEEEFKHATEDHKCQVIMYSISKFPELENHKLLKKTFENLVIKPIEGHEHLTYNQLKTYWIEDDIEERDRNGETGLYDKVYELCWEKAKDVMREDPLFFEDQLNEDDDDED